MAVDDLAARAIQLAIEQSLDGALPSAVIGGPHAGGTLPVLPSFRPAGRLDDRGT